MEGVRVLIAPCGLEEWEDLVRRMGETGLECDEDGPRYAATVNAVTGTVGVIYPEGAEAEEIALAVRRALDALNEEAEVWVRRDGFRVIEGGQ